MALVAELGALRQRERQFILLFHDPHHRAVTDPASMGQFDLRHFDGVPAFGEILRRIYPRKGWAAECGPGTKQLILGYFIRFLHKKDLDLVWIGNWEMANVPRNYRIPDSPCPTSRP